MRTKIYWIPGPWAGRLAIAPRPRGGEWLEDEVTEWRRVGIDVDVALLKEDEVSELELPREEEFCQAHEIQFISFPMTDGAIPESRKAVCELVKTVMDLLSSGKSVLVHCRQGFGRSGIIAACLCIASGETPEAALARIGSARGHSVPDTPEQKAWVMDFAKSMSNLYQ
ncbi:MAG TPA: dual specificity protein phosphatase family protein [Gemmataceae bacterium]|nr:dual specificity protein phosphatase family protein [Gemmataceae bacterium]